jgi:hypothetical protein
MWQPVALPFSALGGRAPPPCRGLAGSGTGVGSAPPWCACTRCPLFCPACFAVLCGCHRFSSDVCAGSLKGLACAVCGCHLSLFRLTCASVRLCPHLLCLVFVCVAGSDPYVSLTVPCLKSPPLRVPPFRVSVTHTPSMYACRIT